MKNYFWLTALLYCFYSAQAQIQTPLKTINFQAIIVDTSAIQTTGGAIQPQLNLKKEVWVKFRIYTLAASLYEELDKSFLSWAVIRIFAFSFYNDNYWRSSEIHQNPKWVGWAQSLNSGTRLYYGQTIRAIRRFCANFLIIFHTFRGNIPI